jgi:hypothetical protein
VRPLHILLSRLAYFLPRFGVYHDQLGYNDELLEFAKQKLLDGKRRLEKKDSSGSLACLSVRFALEFDMASNFRAVTCKQIERHMRLCLAATMGCKTLITFVGSEPLLAEAASQLMHGSMANPVSCLANHPDLHCIDRGRRGELVAALILMQARDMAARLLPPMHRARWVSVSTFMEALLPEQAYIALEGSRPTSWRAGEDKPFVETFQGYAIWFNHVIKVQHDTLINAGHLWSFITRGAMLICAQNQSAVDIVIPICLETERLSRKTVSAILIQVKNSSRYGNEVNTKLFDYLCPFKVGLFDKGSTPRPIIRMVFALASQKSEVHFPEVSESCNKFTSFDIWCAGLSCFRSVNKDDLASYQVLLNRSLQPHDAFDFSESVKDEYSYMDNKTRQARGFQLRRMAALTSDDDEHHWLHL